MSTSDGVVCFTCESAEHVQTNVEEHDMQTVYGDTVHTFRATFPVHHCSNCEESFLTEAGMKARHVAQREFEASLAR
jgi:hypothetical protein